MADEYRIPEAIADALLLEALRMGGGDALLWEVVERLAHVAPYVTVVELRDAMAIYCDRYAAGLDAFASLPTAPGSSLRQ